MTPPPGDGPSQRGELEQFAAQVAHDFNNLLTGVLGNLELLHMRAMRTGAAGLDAYISGATNAGTRAVEFAHRLLVFSGHVAQAPEIVPVARLLRELAAMPEGQGLKLHPPDEALCVRADPPALRQALLELVRNACEAKAEGAPAELAAAAADGWAVITIRDDGPGMPPEILAQAHNLLFTTRANGAGRGLGLAIAAHIAERAGGRLELLSEPGAGCEARLILPLAETAME
jgi:signal transduction histidine kinase